MTGGSRAWKWKDKKSRDHAAPAERPRLRKHGRSHVKRKVRYMDSEKNGTAPEGEERPPAEIPPSPTAGGEAETGGEKGKTLTPAWNEDKAAAAGTGPMRAASPPDSASSGRSANWFGRHKLLSGIAVGILAAVLLGGMFAIGYAVGRPEDGRPQMRSLRQERLWREMRANPPETPLRKFREERLGRLETLMACRDDLADFLAGELGLSAEAFREEMASGKTVADLAEEKGVSTDDLAKSVAAKIEEVADRLAAEGEITSAQAERIKSRAASLASILVQDGPLFFAPRIRR